MPEPVPPVVPPATPPATPPVVPPAAPPAPAVPPVVPASDAVDYKFDPVEGIPPELDASVMEAAKAGKLTADQAKAVREFEHKSWKTAGEAHAAAQAKAKAEADQAKAQMIAGWDKANTEHKEFGGTKSAETEAKIGKLLAEYDTDGSLKKEIESAPEILKHPAFRSFFARLAYAHGESKFVSGAASATGKPKSDAELFYGKA